MSISRSITTSIEILLISPAALFMTALFVRNLQPQQYEPAHTAQQIVMWYAARTKIGLWLFLMALPTLVVLIGGVSLWSQWRSNAELRIAARQFLALSRRHLDSMLIAGASCTAMVVLGIVALHALTD